jgi:RNA polymerase sigma factor (sigma-70 family)
MCDDDIPKLKAGDSDAWKRLIRMCHPLIVWLLRTRFHVPEAFWDDLIQEIWIRVYNALGTTWRPEDRPPLRSLDSFLKAYVGAVAVHRIIDDRRRRQTRREVGLEEWHDVAAAAAAAPSVLNREDIRGQEWNILRLFLEGRNGKQIAKDLGLTETAVSRTKEKLREKLSRRVSE